MGGDGGGVLQAALIASSRFAHENVSIMLCAITAASIEVLTVRDDLQICLTEACPCEIADMP